MQTLRGQSVNLLCLSPLTSRWMHQQADRRAVCVSACFGLHGQMADGLPEPRRIAVNRELFLCGCRQA
jgi:hypothetical protein